MARLPLSRPARILSIALGLALLAACRSGYVDPAHSAGYLATNAGGTPPQRMRPTTATHGGGAFVVQAPSPRMATNEDARSTFSLDQDDASYVQARAWLEGGRLPDPDGVRAEDFVNRFGGSHAAPTHGSLALSVDGEPQADAVGASPDRWVMRLGFRTRAPGAARRPARIVAVLDVSGSMGQHGGIQQARDALRHLVASLGRRDELAIVLVSDEARVVRHMSPLAVGRPALDQLVERLPREVGGGTSLVPGIDAGIAIANDAVDPGTLAHVLLVSDGYDRHHGRGWADAVGSWRARNSTVRVTCVSCGREEHDDGGLEALATAADGRHIHLHDASDAARHFGSAGLDQLLDIAVEGAHVQVAFEPGVVRQWRLVGHQNRTVPDAQAGGMGHGALGGELAPGQSATVLYELDVVPGVSADAVLATVTAWYRVPGNADVLQHAQVVSLDMLRTARPDLVLASAAARLGLVLAEDPDAQPADLDLVARRLESVPTAFGATGDRGELLRLVRKARALLPHAR